MRVRYLQNVAVTQHLFSHGKGLKGSHKLHSLSRGFVRHTENIEAAQKIVL